ncbi:MAG TPA: SDR family oxidoreductase [Mesorhizobium sp.]|jgi:NAD(P)-dependent dehydrogenase (short-subunit alcohol dehydrogenase family)|uniref:SDR family oxidoreductase n=1 Tax=Mesorhizobium sp. TaxID=1871066 RepID=UPI002DDCC67E|nr:SDR family oxidoreductase [Mesorhizobium sp.]HEV2507462.1 SDR family oxidoreductase [Mesorhizobium sp.]
MMILDGKTVLLTGALGTLGRAQAEVLGAAGANLLLLDRPDAEGGEAFASEIATKCQVQSSYVGQDLNDLAATQARAEALAAECGGIDILINNAALIINKPFEAFSLEEYEDQLRVNSAAAFALTRAVAPAMKQRRYGKIVNFCSVTLNGRWDGYVPYVASKGAMLGLTKTLARELGAHGVRVNAVSPGAVVSDAERRVFADRLQEYNDWILENQCLKQRIEPAHVAELVLFLVSPASDLITGQNIHIDGGW